jgi:hypothetical protein
MTPRFGTHALAAGGAWVFVAVLALSAYWDRSIVTLHVLEALPYVAAGVLCARRHTVGYALGAASGAFWLWIAGGQTTFIHNGFTLLGRLLATGRAERWDVLIAVPAALSTGGLVLFSLWAYVRAPKQPARDAALFAGAAVAVVAFFAGTFAAAGPRFLPLIARAFGL